MNNLGVVFLTGLLTGGITCIAVQGGLLAATVAARVGDPGQEKAAGLWDVGIFLMAKIGVHILAGFLLGAVGSAFTFNPYVTGLFQGMAGFYMAGVAAAMLEIHPVFRRFLIQPPRFVKRFVRANSKSGSMFAPAFLGAATVFIPCGTTQAMMILAVASGNPFWGAAILGTFVLGTTPLFVILGIVLTKLGNIAQQKFFKAAGVIVLGVALFSINSALVLTGSRFTGQKAVASLKCVLSYCAKESGTGDVSPADEVTITFKSFGYTVDRNTVKAGSKVKLNLVNEGGYGCIQAFNLPKLGISRTVPPGSRETLELTIPRGERELAFSCSMGMYGGELKVLN